MPDNTPGPRSDRAGEDGFTLIELLVVVVILGVLIAIAIPLYLNYRKGANDAAAQSDLKGAISVLEQCNADNGTYPIAGFPLSGTGPAGSCTRTVNLSSGTSMQYTPGSPVGTSYVLAFTNASGSTKFYCYASSKGGSVRLVTPAPVSGVASVTTC